MAFFLFFIRIMCCRTQKQKLKNTQTSETEVIYKKLVRQTYIILSRSVARKDQIALGLNICKHAYPDVVPEKVSSVVVGDRRNKIKNVFLKSCSFF